MKTGQTGKIQGTTRLEVEETEGRERQGGLGWTEAVQLENSRGRCVLSDRKSVV